MEAEPEASSEDSPAAPSLPIDWRIVLGGLFVVALVLRAIHFREIGLHDPFYQIGSVDGKLYDEGARALLEGEGFGDGVLFLGPLYPTFIAGVYALFGKSLAAVKAVQVVLGALSCVLVGEITKQVFGRPAGVLAGLAAAFYGQHIFYSGTVMIVNLQVPLVLGVILTALHGLRRPAFGIWIVCGALVGLSALARQTTLLLAPILALWILFGMEGAHSFRQRFAWGTAFGVTICALILPFTVRNYVVGDDLVLLNSTGGYNFYMGNQRRADGTWQLPRIDWPYRVDNPIAMRDAFTGVAERELGRELRPSEVSSYWRSRGFDEIRADPARWLALQTKKALLFVNEAEIWNNRSKEVSRRFSAVLRMPLVEMGWIAPLGLLGLILSASRWRELLPLHATLAVYLVAALLFFVLSRYRLPATFALLPFAAFAVVDLIRTARARKLRPFAASVVLLGVFTVLVHGNLVKDNRLHMAFYNLGNKYRALERYEEAVRAYGESLQRQPNAISTHNNLALALEEGGYDQQAIEVWRVVAILGERIGSESHVERAARRLRDLGFVEEAGEAAPNEDEDAPAEARTTVGGEEAVDNEPLTP